jgi:hypothetical protein
MLQTVETKLGITRFFGLGDLGGHNLLDGWAMPEANHNWNDGYDTSLSLHLPEPPDAPCILTVEVRPYLVTGLAHQDVTLFFNGHRLGFWRLDKDESTQLTSVIEPEFWLHRGAGATGTCTWHLPHSTRPSALSPVQDHRLLGLCFLSLTLAPRRVARR